MISRQGTCECCDRKSSGTRLAASPITSISLTSARFNIRSVSISAPRKSSGHFYCFPRPLEHVLDTYQRVTASHKSPELHQGHPAGKTDPSRSPYSGLPACRRRVELRSRCIVKKARPGVCPGSNSTSTSTSLSAEKSFLNADPNSDNFRMWRSRQKLVIFSCGISMLYVVIVPPPSLTESAASPFGSRPPERRFPTRSSASTAPPPPWTASGCPH